jgi:SAM-dependent methyltransferase
MKRSSNSDNIDIFEGDLTSNSNDNLEKYYWHPNRLINKIVENFCISKNLKKNLEIGPGVEPFPLATHFIGSNEKISDYKEVDIDCQKLPFETNFFDFVYCRHVMEDIQNPDFALKEIIRVSKFGGYIETPSPLIEVTKDVDCETFSDKYCGYMHHRYIVWSSIEKNEIYFLPKYSCILDHLLKKNENMLYLLNKYPVYWNNYFIFTKPPTIIMYKNGVNFNENMYKMVEDYFMLVNRAINESIANTNYFIKHYK